MADKKIKDRLKELRAMDGDDLGVAAEAARRSTYAIRRQRISKPVENNKQIRTNRKEVARILTIKREREIAAAKAGK